MRVYLRKPIVYLLACTVTVCTLPRATRPASELPRGSGSADEAAAPPPMTTEGSVFGVGGYTFTYSDTTEYEFPEEEKKHLYRDIAVFVIVSAFVAYFIIKVFIEQDEEPADNPGPPPKPLPTSLLDAPTTPVAQRVLPSLGAGATVVPSFS